MVNNIDGHLLGLVLPGGIRLLGLLGRVAAVPPCQAALLPAECSSQPWCRRSGSCSRASPRRMPLLNILIIVRPRLDVADSSSSASRRAASFGAATSSGVVLAAFVQGGRPHLGVAYIAFFMVQHALPAQSQRALAREALP